MNALLSVSDKTGLLELAKGLHGVGLGLAQRCQVGIDVLDQAGVVKGAHGGSQC